MTEPDDEMPGPPEDGTLGGYFRTHDRPPAFEGPDGHPYTVSAEAERTGDLRAPYQGYLIFPRWAQTGVGIVGHVESPTLSEGRSEDEVMGHLGALTLVQVRRILDESVARAEPQHPSRG